jgi:alpha-1,3-mannosyltransferase
MITFLCRQSEAHIITQDINGTALENAPFESVFHHPDSSNRFQHHLPVQVQSCWNGIAVLDSAPFYSHPGVRFRMAKIMGGECSASECSLICNDFWEAGFGRIMMVPRVKLAYDRKVFDIIHPQRRNLTAIRGYKRLGGLPDDPRTDPQDRSWFGPHDRLFTEEESQPIDFVPGPEHGAVIKFSILISRLTCSFCSLVLGLGWCWRLGWPGCGSHLGTHVKQIYYL